MDIKIKCNYRGAKRWFLDSIFQENKIKDKIEKEIMSIWESCTERHRKLQSGNIWDTMNEMMRGIRHRET